MILLSECSIYLNAFEEAGGVTELRTQKSKKQMLCCLINPLAAPDHVPGLHIPGIVWVLLVRLPPSYC